MTDDLVAPCMYIYDRQPPTRLPVRSEREMHHGTRNKAIPKMCTDKLDLADTFPLPLPFPVNHINVQLESTALPIALQQKVSAEKTLVRCGPTKTMCVPTGIFDQIKNSMAKH